MLTGNIGEWSEIYTFLRVLAEGELYAADDNLDKIKDIYYPIISVIREESGKELNYRRNGSIKIIDAETDTVISELPVTTFSEHANSLLNKIKNDGNEGGSFEFPELEHFLKSIKIERLKSRSTKKDDITLVVHDYRTGLRPTLGFSIKSQLGGASTLLNPGAATNFTYKVTNDRMVVKEGGEAYGESEEMKLKQKVSSKAEEGYSFVFEDTGNPVFTSNLRMIDSLLPEILSYLVLYYYMGKGSTIKTLTEVLRNENPLKFDLSDQRFYEHKIKSFLMDVALGMTPAKVWEGNYLASGGYIIVRDDVEIVCYHIYNIDQFKEYLFNSTKLDTPSTSRYGYGNFYNESEETKIKLNLQIRFNK